MLLARKRKTYEIDMLNGPLLGKILRFSFSLLFCINLFILHKVLCKEKI